MIHASVSKVRALNQSVVLYRLSYRINSCVGLLTIACSYVRKKFSPKLLCLEEPGPLQVGASGHPIYKTSCCPGSTWFYFFLWSLPVLTRRPPDYESDALQNCYPISFLSYSSISSFPNSSAYIFIIYVRCRILLEVLYLFNLYALRYYRAFPQSL